MVELFSFACLPFSPWLPCEPCSWLCLNFCLCHASYWCLYLFHSLQSLNYNYHPIVRKYSQKSWGFSGCEDILESLKPAVQIKYFSTLCLFVQLRLLRFLGTSGKYEQYIMCLSKKSQDTFDLLYVQHFGQLQLIFLGRVLFKLYDSWFSLMSGNCMLCCMLRFVGTGSINMNFNASTPSLELLIWSGVSEPNTAANFGVDFKCGVVNTPSDKCLRGDNWFFLAGSWRAVA